MQWYCVVHKFLGSVPLRYSLHQHYMPLDSCQGKYWMKSSKLVLHSPLFFCGTLCRHLKTSKFDNDIDSWGNIKVPVHQPKEKAEMKTTVSCLQENES